MYIFAEKLQPRLKRPIFLQQWKSCCDGKTKLAIPVSSYMYELKSAYGQVVRRRPTVADQVYPEILRRILNKPDLQHEDDLKNQIITVYQIIQYHEVII